MRLPIFGEAQVIIYFQLFKKELFRSKKIIRKVNLENLVNKSFCPCIFAGAKNKYQV